MGAHPNVLLIAVIKPDETSRKTMRAILGEAGDAENDGVICLPGGTASDSKKTGEVNLYHLVMEGSYDDGWQIEAKEGDLIFFEMVTYGYGEFLTWADLERRKTILDEWCRGICERHKCAYEIRVSANHW